ncbi:hypothetical protein C8R43DRAFT_1177831 [Mycena crocata]|nr:hypothetical protein C8R43DRAFT_1177831 [Mycena crocata]
MTQKQHDTEKLRKEGTGDWFFKGPNFTQWLNRAGSLWIEGPSGAGKSVLSATVVKLLFSKLARQTQLKIQLQKLQREKKLRHGIKPPPSLALAFFYFDFRNKDAQSVEIALRRIVLQLSAHSPRPYTILNNEFKESNGQKLPTYEDLIRILQQLLRELRHTYIVLDALDECGDSEFRRLVEFVSLLRKWTKTPLHLLISSQPRLIFTKSFQSLPRIQLDVHLIRQDIQFFIANEIKNNLDLEIWRPHAAEVTERITRKSNGMFRLAACLLIEVSRCPWQDSEELEKCLENLPEDLFGIYDRFIQAIPANNFPYVEAALRWLFFSKPDSWWLKSFDDLADAVAFDFSDPMQYVYKPNRREGNKVLILNCLAGLVEIDRGTVRLAHASVQDYLLSKRFKQTSACDLTESISHIFISRSCISCFFYFDNHPLGKDDLESRRYPLVRYAARNWYDGELMRSNERKTLLPLAMQLLESGTERYKALEHTTAFSWSSTVLPPLHFCCTRGYIECVSWCIANGADLDLVSDRGSPLGLASYFGRMDIVQLLLDAGANITVVKVQFA